jgi:hypothetical protein
VPQRHSKQINIDTAIYMLHSLTSLLNVQCGTVAEGCIFGPSTPSRPTQAVNGRRRKSEHNKNRTDNDDPFALIPSSPIQQSIGCSYV